MLTWFICPNCKTAHQKQSYPCHRPKGFCNRSCAQKGEFNIMAGKKQSPESIAKNKTTNKANALDPNYVNPFQGKKHNKTTRKQMKASSHIRWVVRGDVNGKKKYFSEREAKQANAAYTAMRKALKKDRTPNWVDPTLMTAFYLACPKGYHVDHIIPLNRGGTHEPANLQFLETSENISKSDKLPCEWTKYRIEQHKKGAHHV